MTLYPIFLSVVLVVENDASTLQKTLASIGLALKELVSDFELIVVDNSSTDDSVEVLRQLTRPEGLPNLQIYALTKKVDIDTASWVGLENALGDFVAVMDPVLDDITFLPALLDKATKGTDVVFATNEKMPKQGWVYRTCYALFNFLYKRFNGVNLSKEAPQYRVLSKTVVNFLLRHPMPSVTYRHLPATGGFSKAHLSYEFVASSMRKKNLGDSIERGTRLLVSTTTVPMRLVTTLTLFGAVANLIYSVYVISVGLFKSDVAPGWVTLSLQQSGMFFLLSLVLLVLGEYILHMSSLANEGPKYHIGQEFTSAIVTRGHKLNVEEPDRSSAPLKT